MAGTMAGTTRARGPWLVPAAPHKELLQAGTECKLAFKSVRCRCPKVSLSNHELYLGRMTTGCLPLGL